MNIHQAARLLGGEVTAGQSRAGAGPFKGRSFPRGHLQFGRRADRVFARWRRSAGVQGLRTRKARPPFFRGERRARAARGKAARGETPERRLGSRHACAGRCAAGADGAHRAGVSRRGAGHYRDEAGATLFFVLRYNKPGGKDFFPLTLWRTQSGALAWRWKGVPSRARSMGGQARRAPRRARRRMRGREERRRSRPAVAGLRGGYVAERRR